MATLAIKGHPTRGREIVEILEMLGGKNKTHIKAKDKNVAYSISEDGQMYGACTYRSKSNLVIYTLEEFLKKFPYKVGDSVSSKYLKNYKIEKAEWVSHGNRVIYKLQGMGWHSVEDLQPDKEETVEEIDIMDHTTEINLNHPCFKGCNEIEIIIPDGWEFKQRDNKMFGVRKQYPKTYEECCKAIGCDSKMVLGTMPVRYNILVKLETLLVCRDAYWKIAGKEMGLGKPWEPDWNKSGQLKYVLICMENNIIKYAYAAINAILAFPTEEMRDAFYENFKDLIEECKEFL